jgi:hypothetical protein
VSDSDLSAAWDALHDATPTGWYVGRPSYHDEGDEWQQYAFDPSERAVVGVTNRQWTAIASTEVGVVREIARCLAEASRARQSIWPSPACSVTEIEPPRGFLRS